jgi:hypothetical protein
VPSAVEAVRQRSAAWSVRLDERIVVGALVLLQWAAIAVIAHAAPHSGWVYAPDADSARLHAAALRVSHGHLPGGPVGFLWPILLAPFVGSSPSSGLPVVVLVQVLVLLPLALVATYCAGTRIGGRTVGTFAAALVALLPLVATKLFVGSYHATWHDKVLPRELGLTASSALPAAVALAGAAVFVLRVLDGAGHLDAVAAGVLVGLAIAMHPPAALVLVGVVAGLVVARRWRGLAGVTVGLVPALVALAVWRLSASGATFFAWPHLAWSAYDRTVNVQLREVFASRRLLEFLPLAGIVAVARSSFAKAAFVGGWLLAMFLVEVPRTSVYDTSFWRLMTPAWPALALLLGSLVLLLPTLGGRLVASGPVTQLRHPRAVVAALAVAALVPLVVVAVLAL